MSAYFANRIKEKREKNGYTQKQLGEMIGVDDTLIFKYEASEAIPPFDKVMKMASIFHTTSEELMGVKQNVEKKYNATVNGYYAISGNAPLSLQHVASQKVLNKCGFKSNGKIGEEGPRFIVYKEGSK